MITPKFFTIYNYQKEIFSILISASSPSSEIPSLLFNSFLTSNFNIKDSFKAYKYTPLNAFPNAKFAVVNDFESYLLTCSNENSCINNPCLNFTYVLNTDKNKGVYFGSSSSFYSRCTNQNLTNYIYNNVNSVKELDCVYENGIVSSSFFIKDTNAWKHEYIDYYLCWQDDIKNNISSVLNFNKFNTDVDDISSSRSVNGFFLIHSFLKSSDYNRKNIIAKSEFLLKKHYGNIFLFSYKVVDYSTSSIGSLTLRGNNGGDLQIQYFNSINFYTDAEVRALETSFSRRPSYLKSEDSKYVTVNDLRGETSDAINLPPAKFDSKGFPIKRYVKITKLSPETRSSLIKRDINLEKITEVIPNNFSYPFSAVVATKLDSRTMSSLPARSFDCKLKKILIPSNYFPLDNMGRDLRYSQSRGANIIYKGIWDGTFKLGWTDNPAWILMDLLINKRYGLGNYIEANQIDIWELYQIAKWCDACDENGIFWGVPDTYSGYEPRHSFNALITEKYNVYDMINNIMSIFNGIVFYSNSIISFDDNRLKDISGTIASNEVSDGIFNFGNFKKDDEFTVIEVSYLDKRDHYKPKIEYVEDAEAIRKRGVLKKQVAPIGITSRGQAIRYAKHILFQTAKESSNVSFSIDSKILAYGIGDLVKLATDAEDKKQIGKILEVSSSPPNIRIFVDACLSDNFFDTSKLDVLSRKQMSNGTQTYFDMQKCTYFIKSYSLLCNDVVTSGTYITLENSGIRCVNNSFAQQDSNYNECVYQLFPKTITTSEFNETSIYSLRTKEKKDKIYKINSITENSASEFSVFATEFCSTKFDIIEGESPRDINIENYFYISDRNNSIIKRPSAAYFSNVETILNIAPNLNGIKVYWNAIPNVDGYNIYIIRPNSIKEIFVRSISGTSGIFSGSTQIGGYDLIKKEYFYIFLETSSVFGTYKFGIESFIFENNNTSKRTSEMTTKTYTL